MSKVIAGLGLFFYFFAMLLLTKRSIQLLVHYAPPKLRVFPGVHSPAEERLAATFAKNEELLAGVYLSITDHSDWKAQLVTYFTHRGWQVEHKELPA